MSDLSASFRLDGRTALVTGASRGIGRAIAEALAEAGANVVLAARTQADLDEAAETIRAAGGRALAVAAHTGSDEAVAALVARAEAEFGGVDVLVNNAATNPHFGPMLTATDAQWEKTFGVNVLGYARTVRAVVPGMVSRGRGSIVNVASVAGERPLPGMGVYCASKAAVLMMSDALAAELAGQGVRVNAVVPGFVRTQFSSVLWQNEAAAEQTLRLVPQRRMADPSEIAPLVLYLASSASSFVTGGRFRIDGGQLVGTPGA